MMQEKERMEISSKAKQAQKKTLHIKSVNHNDTKLLKLAT